MKIYLSVVFLLLINCNAKYNDSELQKNKIDQKATSIFNYSYLAPTMERIIEELGGLPNEQTDSLYCNWLLNYKRSLRNRILKDNLDKNNFQIVGFAKSLNNKCYVDYNGQCELIGIEEIPNAVTNIFNNNLVCAKREENRFKPECYSNSFSKTTENSNGYKCIIQVWYNVEKE